MKKNFKYSPNLPLQVSSKAIKPKNYRDKFKFTSPLDSQGLTKNNRYFNTNKKEEKINSVNKIQILERNSEETKYSSKISNIDLFKVKINKSHNSNFFDIMANKTIHSNHRNISSNLQIKHSPIKTLNNEYALNTFSNFKSSFEKDKNINKFEMDKIISFTNTIFYPKTTKKIKEIKDSKNWNAKKRNKTNKFNSLNCFIDDYMSKDNHEFRKYKINFRDYMGDTEYEKLCEKEKTYLTEANKIKLIYKNTNLMKALFDYLNLSFVKLKNEKNERLKTLNKERDEIRKRNKYLKSLKNNCKYNLIPTKDIFNSTKKKKSTFNRNLFLLRNSHFSKDKIN